MDSALFLVFRFLTPGMLLRAGAVCKEWCAVANDDELWIIILARESKQIPGYSQIDSFHINVKINRNIVNKKKNKQYYAKKLYLTKRKREFRNMELTKPGSTASYRIFDLRL